MVDSRTEGRAGSDAAATFQGEGWSEPIGVPQTPAAPRAAVEEAVGEVAERLRDPERVREIVSAHGNADPFLGVPPWSALSLGDGYPGVAMLYARLGHADNIWRPVTHACLSAAVSRLGSPDSATGLYHGAPALVFAVRCAVAGPRDYAGLLTALDARVADHVGALLARERSRRASGARGVALAGYDVIAGLTGLGRYLLACGEAQRPLLREVLAHLVDLSRPLRTAGRELPGWWVPDPPSPAAGDAFPHGHLNLGLAHGIPGPLALLALAHREGITVPGMDEAMHRIADWLLGHRCQDTAGPSWPACLAPDHEHVPGGVIALPTRAAWCYGTPGVARALQLAGQALGERTWETEAVHALHAVLDRPREEWGLRDAMICHGTAGLLQIVTRVAHDSGDVRLSAWTERLTDEVMAHHDPAAAFAFPSTPPPGAVQGTGERQAWARDRAGFLEGAAGTALALFGRVEPGAGGTLPWDAALLIA
ncbi:lanthionine synthetase C family protein [Streptomyces griseocarneus]|nr:lanthionine synthetase C family protein [Streptomyces griseocarneus]